MAIIHLLPNISGAAWRGLPGTPNKPQRKRTGKITVPDEVVLQMRRMYEIERKTTKQVTDAYPHLSKTYVRNVLGYQVRAILRIHK